MKGFINKRGYILLPILLISVMISCSKEMQSTPEEQAVTAMSEDMARVNLPGRTLAANCFQCHGTNGHAQELGIAGMGAAEIIGDINDMKGKSPGENIMNVHAMAYTDAEIKLIADFFSKQ
jgi:cytochrome subunit of sulfide dehydrogenase